MEVRNDTEPAYIKVEESLIFQTYVTFSIEFPSIYNDYLLAIVIDSSLLLFWLAKAILSPGAYGFLTSSVHVSLDTVLNQI